MKKALSLALALLMVLSLLPVAAFAAGTQYDDIDGHWAKSSIERWSEYKIVEGSEGHFRPDASLTRAEMAKILAGTLGLTEAGAENPFADVAADAWYAPYVLRCYTAGIMKGDGANAKPTASITRQEAMVMLCRALAIAAQADADLSAYGDSNDVADWAKGAVAAMTQGKLVNGVGENKLAPTADIDRASIMAILDRAIVQYINTPGSHTLTDKDGVILVAAAGDVTLTGKTPADILVTPAAKGRSLSFDKAEVTGAVTVQADGMKVTKSGSKLPEIVTTGKNITVEDAKPAASVGGGNGGSSKPSYSDLTVAEPKTVDGGEENAVKTYQNVTVTDAVADGTVTLSNMTILGNLYINGGGSNTVNLENVVIRGRIIINKKEGEAPRLCLTNTPVTTVEVEKPAIIEAADAASTVTTVQAKANVEIRGANTAVNTLAVPANVETAVDVAVTAGKVAKVDAKSETAVSGAGSVAEVVAQAPVTVSAEAVGKVTVSAGAPENVAVAVSGTGSVEVAVNSDKGAAITTTPDAEGNKATVEISSELETPPAITVDGEAVEHIHQWGAWVPAGEHDYDGHKRVCKTDETHVETAKHTFHMPGDWIYVDKDTCKNVCDICGFEEAAPHNKVRGKETAPTCTEPGQAGGESCSSCGTVFTKPEVIPALGHNFTGDYLTDADGHWHKCSRCDVTDTKAAHTYPSEASCDEAVRCTACGYEKAAGAHTWGEWVKADDVNHKHVCTTCKTEAAAPHTWDDGVVTKEPTENESGVKTYTCTACKATKTETLPAVPARKLWVEYNNKWGALNFVWNDTLESNEYYGVNGNYQGTYNQYYLANINWMDQAADETMTFSITKGTLTNGKYTATADVAEAGFDVKVVDASGSISIAPQDDGTYLATGGNQGYNGYYYRLKDPRGEVLGTVGGSATLNGIMFDGAPYEGCTFEVSQFKIEFEGPMPQDDRKYIDRYEGIKAITVTKPQSIAITADNLPVASAEPVTVTTYDELNAALSKGGKVILGADITCEQVAARSGAPAELVLNGHTLTCTTYNLQVILGKQLTIDGTTAGSGIRVSNSSTYSISTGSGAKLTVNGGAYTGFGSSQLSEVTLNNVTVENQAGTNGNVLQFHGGKVTVNGGSITARSGRAYFDGCEEVTVTNATFTGNFDITDCPKATVSGCTFTLPEDVTNGWLSFYGTTATLAGNTTEGPIGVDVRSIWEKPGNVTIKSGTYIGGVYVCSNADSKNVASTLTIEGGTFSTTYSDQYIARLQDKGNLYISGGDFSTFAKLLDTTVSTSDPGTVEVTGGTFGFDPGAYVADGCTATQGGTEEAPTWTVSAVTP